MSVCDGLRRVSDTNEYDTRVCVPSIDDSGPGLQLVSKDEQWLYELATLHNKSPQTQRLRTMHSSRGSGIRRGIEMNHFSAGFHFSVQAGSLTSLQARWLGVHLGEALLSTSQGCWLDVTSQVSAPWFSAEGSLQHGSISS